MIDYDDPGNYGFQAVMQHADGETYVSLCKEETDLLTAVRAFAKEEREHDVVCLRIERWKRGQQLKWRGADLVYVEEK